ncbi:nucleic-acid-binding protein from transposon X-element [Trichonephila clavipes]|nr:nucleic-acid-binding protein from transposon X-element [Trichonephila clavipes]
MAGEKQLKTVIRGLPSDFDVDEIIQELGTHNITPEHVSVMRNRKQNKNMPLFLVVSRKCPANQAIFQVTSIGYYKIKVEPLDKIPCQPNVTGASFFSTIIRASVTGAKMLEMQSKSFDERLHKKPDAPARECANCGWSHPELFQGVKKTQNLKPSKPPTKNVWHERGKL